MLFTTIALAALASVGKANSVHARVHANRHIHLAERATATSGSGDSSLTLNANAIQSGSFFDGSKEIGAAEVGQALSATSTDNFINFCAGSTLTNGLQITTGSCNGIPMGQIPPKTKMVSSIITYPEAGSATIESDTTFNITVQTSNLDAGSFTNADATYYAAPQVLVNGIVQGHTHVTVQNMGASLNPTTALDPTQFAFFKGINDAGNGQGLLSATVTGGLPAGNYRVCTMASASNHQPVLMPVAQRGTSDDCTKFTVIGTGTTPNAASNNGSGGLAAAAAAALAVSDGPGFIVSSTTSSSNKTTSTTSAAGKDITSTSISKSSNTTTTAKGGNGKNTATSTTSIISTTTKDGNGKKTTTSTASTTSTTTKSGNRKGTTTSTTSTASKATTSAKGNNATTSSILTTTNAGKAVSSSSTVSAAVSTKSVTGKSSSGSTIAVVEIVTYFNFTSSLGSLPPAVGQGSSTEEFIVEKETFTELTLACNAACGKQFSSCISFAGKDFSEEECQTQSVSCIGVASTATPTASSPATLTATVTVPTTNTSASVTLTGADSKAATGAANSESACTLTTQTTTVFAQPTGTTACAAPNTVFVTVQPTATST